MAKVSPLRAGRSRQVLSGRILQIRAERTMEGAPATYRELARDLGVSESTLYKVRKGTRSGSQVLPKIRARTKQDMPAYQVILERREGDRTEIKSINVGLTRAELKKAGIKNPAFAGPRLAPRTDLRERVEDALLRQGAATHRRRAGSVPWTKQQVGEARIVSVRRPRITRSPLMLLHLKSDFPTI